MNSITTLIANGEFSDATACCTQKRYAFTSEVFDMINGLIEFERLLSDETVQCATPLAAGERRKRIFALRTHIDELAASSAAPEARQIASYVAIRLSFIDFWSAIFGPSAAPGTIFDVKWVDAPLVGGVTGAAAVDDMDDREPSDSSSSSGAASAAAAAAAAAAGCAVLYSQLTTSCAVVGHIREIVGAMRRFDALLCGLRIAAAVHALNAVVAAAVGSEESRDWELPEGWAQHKRFLHCPRLRLLASIVWGLWGRAQLLFSHIFEPSWRLRVVHAPAPDASKPSDAATGSGGQPQGNFFKRLFTGYAKQQSPKGSFSAGSVVGAAAASRGGSASSTAATTPSASPAAHGAMLRRLEVHFPALLANGCADLCSALSDLVDASCGGRFCLVAHSPQTLCDEHRHTLAQLGDTDAAAPTRPIAAATGLAAWALCFCCGEPLASEKEEHNLLAMVAFQAANMRAAGTQRCAEFSQRQLFFVHDAGAEIADGVIAVLVRDASGRSDTELKKELEACSAGAFAALASFLATWGMPNMVTRAGRLSL